MKKETYEINLEYIFCPERKNAKYSINNGLSFMNGGDFCECLAKSVLGFEVKKDANIRYDKGHDIEELKASVKSWNCGLTDRKDMPKSPKEFLEKFWETENSEMFIWVFPYSEMVDLWYMDRNEFKKFVEKFASWDNYCTKFRIKTCNNKINAWLEENL